MRELISIQKAYTFIADSLSVVGHETVDLDDAHGRIIAATIIADRPIPPYDRVMMDGIAIRHDSFAKGQRAFAIAGTQSAGMPELKLADSTGCLEVMTGAILPNGTDTVIKIEQLEIKNNIATITDSESVGLGQHIHPTGSDQRMGAPLVLAGTLLGGPELAIAASVGHTQFKVSKRPRILLITTGDEVIPASDMPEPYQIRRSHYYAICSSIESQKLGIVTNTHVPDSVTELKSTLQSGLENYDVVLLTGGISKGEFDYVAPVMEALVGDPCFHGVAQRPGKPFAFWNGQTPVFALPGNPVSVMACLARYVLPNLRQMRGESWKPQSLSLTNDTVWNAPFTGLVACRINENQIHPTPPRNSGDYTALAGCDGICELPSTTRAGTLLPFYPW